MLDVRNRLRLTPCKHIAVELRTCQQTLGDGANGFEPPQPQGQRIGHVFGALALGRIRIRQQHARLQIGNPRCHHEIIGRELKPQPARLFDERKELVGQRENGNFGEVHLLLTRKHQQQIERTFETFDVNDQSRLVRSPLRRQVSLEFEFVCAHDAIRAAVGRPASSVSKVFRASTGSMVLADWRAASAASARRAGSPASRGASAATSSISLMLPLQCRTTSQPAASAARTRSPIVPDSAPIDRSSLISSPLKPIESRITCATIVAEVVAGAMGSNAVNTTCAVMPIGSCASGRNAAKSLTSSNARSALTTGSCWWLSAVARPWPGKCLSTGNTPPAMSPFATAPASAATFS